MKGERFVLPEAELLGAGWPVLAQYFLPAAPFICSQNVFFLPCHH